MTKVKGTGIKAGVGAILAANAGYGKLRQGIPMLGRGLATLSRGYNTLAKGAAIGAVAAYSAGDNYSDEAGARNMATGAAIGAGAAFLVGTKIGRSVLGNTVLGAVKGIPNVVKSVLSLTGIAAKAGHALLSRPRLLGAAGGLIGAAALINSSESASKMDEGDIAPDYQSMTQSWHNLQSSTTGLTFGLHRGRHR
jgi:hypothetical protein